ncbi:MAG: OmpA family protein [Candidatus Cloacimonetes bacterium]|nr:OmpA family protein [Candidatus Cloacimonadota bacterium]
MARAKKCPECPPVGAPSYMLTYGDMMTLLVTFFVLLISYSNMNEIKFSKAMASLKGAMGVLKADAGAKIRRQNIPMYEWKNNNELQYKIERVLQQLQDITDQTGTHEMVRVEQDAERIHFSIANPMLFELGAADLKTEAKEILEQISSILELTPYTIRVEGHTDNIPIKTTRFPSNWELSASRAIAVVRFFADTGIDPGRFEAIGYSKNRPIATNQTSLGRAQNRRVEIYVNLKKEIRGSLLQDKLNVLPGPLR